MDRQTDRQAGMQTDRQTDIQVGRRWASMLGFQERGKRANQLHSRVGAAN